MTAVMLLKQIVLVSVQAMEFATQSLINAIVMRGTKASCVKIPLHVVLVLGCSIAQVMDPVRLTIRNVMLVSVLWDGVGMTVPCRLAVWRGVVVRGNVFIKM